MNVDRQVFVYEVYFEKGNPHHGWYGIQITDIGNVIDFTDDDNKLVDLLKHLSKRYKIVVDEGEEYDLIDDVYGYRKLTDNSLLKQLKAEGII